MRTWDTFGAFGDTVVELSWLDMLRLLCRRNVEVPGRSVVISLGNSGLASFKAAPSREKQLAKQVANVR